MKEPVLVIMAAGMGSRYGGLKQIDPVGAHGEKIIDYSLFDARRAGFKKALFIIKEELLPDFQEAVFQKVSQYMEVEWVFQRLEDVPQGVEIPEGRQKPWGTGQATWDTECIPFCIYVCPYFILHLFHHISHVTIDSN